MAIDYSSYSGYPMSNHWNPDSKPLGEATTIMRSFVQQNIVNDSEWEIDRVTKYYLFWKFYEGLHYKDFNDGLLSFNYVRAFIDKVIMFLLGDEAFSLQVKSYYTSQVDRELEALVEQLLLYHWGKSGKETVAYEMLQMGSITGDCWAGVRWDEEEKFCKVEVYDSRQVFPEFENGDYNRIKSIRIRQTLDASSNNKGDFKMWVREISKTHIREWYQKGVEIHNPKKIDERVSLNKYGIIPIVHIKNKPNSAGFYGKSDANDILKINKVYNEMNQTIKSVIDYHVAPTTVITGASAKSLKKGLGQIWSGLPAEANVFNLGLDVDLSAATNFTKDLKTAMHELSDVPENALGKIQAISNTSAAALQITYHPLVQQANLKDTMYGEGITKLNSIILKILQKEAPQDERLGKILEMSPEFLTEMKVVPVFAFGFPKDKMDDLQRAQLEAQLKIGSRREWMERMGKQNVPELLQEIDEDMIEQAMLQVKLQETIGASMGGSPMGGSPMGGNEEEQEIDEDMVDSDEDMSDSDEDGDVEQ